MKEHLWFWGAGGHLEPGCVGVLRVDGPPSRGFMSWVPPDGAACLREGGSFQGHAAFQDNEFIFLVSGSAHSDVNCYLGTELFSV